MTNIKEIAEVIRTKNAGPYTMTADIIMHNYDVYRKVKASGKITRDLIASLYGIPKDDVLGILYFDEGKAIKINLRRPFASGDIGDTDVFAMQQHVPLLGLEFDI